MEHSEEYNAAVAAIEAGLFDLAAELILDDEDSYEFIEIWKPLCKDIPYIKTGADSNRGRFGSWWNTKLRNRLLRQDFLYWPCSYGCCHPPTTPEEILDRTRQLWKQWKTQNSQSS